VSKPQAAPELAPNPFAALEDKADPRVPTATLQIYQFIAEYLERPSERNPNRASSAPQCYKRRWYEKQGLPGEALTPRKMVNFLLGDLAERVMIYFVTQACVGPGKLYSEVDFGEVVGTIHFQGKELKIYKQETHTLDIGGVTVTAHADGWGKRNSDGKWELIEKKSAANWGFKDFQTTGPKEYLKQSMVLLQTDKAKRLGADSVRYFYLRKETGHLWDRVFPFSEELWYEVVQDYRISNGPTEPKAPFLPKWELFRGKPTGRRIAEFPCTYCPFLERCHGKHDVDWKADQFGNLRPVYVFDHGGKK
jgi:hypothetical protein